MTVYKKYLLPLLLVIAALAQGCVVTSVHPLYTEKDVVFDKALLGEWDGGDGDEKWLFREGKDKAYHLIIFDEKQTMEFEVRLVRLGSGTFMDMTPGEKTLEKMTDSIFLLLHYVPVHSFSKITLEGDALHLGWGIDPDWFKVHVEKSAKPEVRFEKDDRDMYLLTDNTSALQRFVRKHADETGFFGETDTLRRIRKTAQ